MGEGAVTFGRRVRELRHQRGLTIYEVAAAIHRDYTYVSKIETDRCLPPSAEIIVALATLLGTDPEALAILGEKPPVRVLRQQLAQISEVASNVTRLWDQLGRCEDEFLPEDPGACGELHDRLDIAIDGLMKLVDREMWDRRQAWMREAAEIALRETDWSTTPG